MADAPYRPDDELNAELTRTTSSLIERSRELLARLDSELDRRRRRSAAAGGAPDVGGAAAEPGIDASHDPPADDPGPDRNRFA